jgi:hypothetical protein
MPGTNEQGCKKASCQNYNKIEAALHIFAPNDFSKQHTADTQPH